MDSQDKRNLAALAIALVLLLAGLWLASVLRKQGEVQDCLLAGRRNCDAVLQR